MAVTKLWDVRGRLDHPLDYVANLEKTVNPVFGKKEQNYDLSEIEGLRDVMDYATDMNKTDRQYYVSGINCNPRTARTRMQMTKEAMRDESRIIAYHAIQSFKPGEVAPDKAHLIGRELAERMWGDRFEVVIATHLNTDCVHNHFVLNSVSFKDGKHYYDNKANLRRLRETSDQICREHGLSIIENPRRTKDNLRLSQLDKAGMPTRYNQAREAIDEAIRRSMTLTQFQTQLEQMGYAYNFNPKRKYWTITPKGWEKPIRLYRLGEDYTQERITERILSNDPCQIRLISFQKRMEHSERKQTVRLRGSFQKSRKRGGLRGLYFYYCYRLGILPKDQGRSRRRVHHYLQEDLMKVEQISKEARFLNQNRIDTMEDLQIFQMKEEQRLEELIRQREICRRDLRRRFTEGEEAGRRYELAEYRKDIQVVRQNLRFCESVEKRSKHMRETIAKIRTEGKEKEVYEQQWRSSGTDRENESGRSGSGS